MPLYEYEFKPTGRRVIVSTQEDKAAMDRGVQLGDWRRIFSFNMGPTFSGVNPEDPRAEPITSKSKYRSELSRLSDEHSTRHNGMEVNYQPVDIRDPREVGVSEAGVEMAERKKRDG